ncbi:MAG: amidohydrolase family protein [Acidaminococcales bacterium]|jgi:N-acyl-D-amino-acid deacylase|nr:amidohydrolase family protein [Acidaminococcales bacterium]
MFFDAVIENGILVDPEAMTSERKNIGITGGRIAAVSREKLSGKDTFDAAGQLVAPGFIDIHGHIDGNFYSAELSLRQGITTTVGGNCGSGPLLMADFFARQQSDPLPINQAELFGMTYSLRAHLGGIEPLMAAGRKEIEKMKELAQTAFAEGACGLSIGLAYAPGSSDEEIYSLAEIAAKYGRIVSVDTRMRTPLDLYSLVEVLLLAKNTGARVQISHFVYQYGDGLVEEALSAIDRARGEGIDVRLDSGMYTQWATGLQAVLFDRDYLRENQWDFSDILVITGPYKGRRLDPELYDRLRAAGNPGAHTSVVVFTGVESEIYAALRHPWCMPSTDTGRYLPGEGHPQIAGSFPRYFRKMVVEKNFLTVEEAVRKATLLPAQTLGLKTKGRLRAGCDADIVTFDLARMADRAGFLPEKQPDAPPEGIGYVFVNGSLALENGQLKNIRAGRPIIF